MRSSALGPPGAAGAEGTLSWATCQHNHSEHQYNAILASHPEIHHTAFFIGVLPRVAFFFLFLKKKKKHPVDNRIEEINQWRRIAVDLPQCEQN